VVTFTLRPLYPQGKSPWYPLDRGLGRPLSWSEHSEEKNSHPLLGLEPPIIQPVAQRYTTELSRFVCMVALYALLPTITHTHLFVRQLIFNFRFIAVVSLTQFPCLIALGGKHTPHFNFPIICLWKAYTPP
jgi:hypothetical protein